MDHKKITTPGLWQPAIDPATLAQIATIKDVQVMNDGTIIWLESRDGKPTLMARRPGDAVHKIVAGANISGPIGYGGGEFTVFGEDIYFSGDGRINKVSKFGGPVSKATRQFGNIASIAIDPYDARALAVHSSDRRDSIILTDLREFAWPVELVSGADFYMQPTWHPDGMRIAWIEWDHPQMPWDGTRLISAELMGSSLTNIRQIAGATETPIFQPEFSPDGRYLSYIACSGEYDTLYLLDLETQKTTELIQNRILMQPAWLQGMRTYSWGPDGIFIFETHAATRTLWHVSISGNLEQISTEKYTWLEQISVSPITGDVCLIASSAKTPQRVIRLHTDGIETIHRSAPENIHEGYMSEPVAINWPAQDGTITHALFYPPANPFCASDDQPPLIVNVHGGPTSARNVNFDENALFFTSRGYAYAELNHRGSTGYGRSYMLKLRRHWGKVDVEDAVDCANAIAELGLADRSRMVIMGGSAGGYTTLNTLIWHPGVFKIGINLYGVSNLFDFMIETHKFEEKYNESLVGVYPKDSEWIKELSPSEHLDQIRDPMLVFQGEIDPVVPKAHSDLVVEALIRNRIPHHYQVYAGEGHGFKKISTILDMYTRIDQALKEWLLI